MATRAMVTALVNFARASLHRTSLLSPSLGECGGNVLVVLFMSVHCTDNHHGHDASLVSTHSLKTIGKPHAAKLAFLDRNLTKRSPRMCKPCSSGCTSICGSGNKPWIEQIWFDCGIGACFWPGAAASTPMLSLVECIAEV